MSNYRNAYQNKDNPRTKTTQNAGTIEELDDDDLEIDINAFREKILCSIWGVKNHGEGDCHVSTDAKTLLVEKVAELPDKQAFNRITCAINYGHLKTLDQGECSKWLIKFYALKASHSHGS